MSNDVNGEQSSPEESGELQALPQEEEKVESPSSGIETFLENSSIPKEVRHEMATFMAKSGPSYPPFLDKVSSEHITSVLDSSENDSKRSHWRAIFFAVLVGGIFLATMFFLGSSNPDLFEKVITFLAGFGGGGGIGYGLAKSR